MPKRRNPDDGNLEFTPRKSRRSNPPNGVVASPALAHTPSNRKSILKGTPTKANGTSEVEATPKSLRKVLFSTPARPVEANGTENASATRSDRSARRKSVRALQQNGDDGSDDDDDAQGFVLAKEILEEQAGDEGSEDEETEAPTSSAANTPKKRGRPKGKRRERTPSPPPDLPPHELYFFQNRTGANKTSANTLPSHLLLNHEDYYTQVTSLADPHEQDIKRLKALHKRAFDQWIFELSQKFNLCLYGYGSKRKLVMDFAQHLHTQAPRPPKIVVVNGYTPGLTVHDIFTTVAKILEKTGLPAVLPGKVDALADVVFSHLKDHPPPMRICLIIHSIDHPNLRTKSFAQPLLARLACNPAIKLIATCDNPNFGLLWSAAMLKDFRWLYHDATTFEPYIAELDVVEEVNQLLGRGRRRLGGKDGVAYVLKSLPENARNLFRILIAEQLALMDVETSSAKAGAAANGFDDDIIGAEDDEMASREQGTPSRRGRGPKANATPAKAVARPTVSAPEGVEYRTLYNKAVEEFVCSSELNFRTLLKEFHDHQMIESRKDALGTERLIVPFGKEELESVLEELI